MKNLLSIMILVLVGVACNESPQQQPLSYYKGDVTESREGIRYFQDTRTGICYAERIPYNVDSYAFTEVPCDKVNAYYGVPSSTPQLPTNVNKETKK